MSGDFRIHLEIDYVPFIWVMAIFFSLYVLDFIIESGTSRRLISNLWEVQI